MKHLALLVAVFVSACLSVQPRCRDISVPVTWQSGQSSAWAVRVCNVQKPVALHFVNDLKVGLKPAPAPRRGCGPYQCSLMIYGTEHCYEEGDSFATPCCDFLCVCQDQGLDCGWEM